MANTGYQGGHTLQQYYGDGAGENTGVTKPNTYGQPDYIQPIPNTGACPIGYYNTAQTATANRTDCPTGLTGGSNSYTVPAGAYGSQVSQADADAQAYNAALGYAQSGGTCGTGYLMYSYNMFGDACAGTNVTTLEVFGDAPILESILYTKDGDAYIELWGNGKYFNIDGNIREYTYNATYGHNTLGPPISCDGGGGGGGVIQPPQ
jgi:hypothetical protein